MNIRILFIVLTISLISVVMGQSNTIDLQGHRGCRGLMPENTIPAMIKALTIGVTTLEMDVVITKDKQVVLSHEAHMNPEIATSPENSTTSDIYKMDYVEVKKWDVGLKRHQRFPNQMKIPAYKPLLSELIDSVENYIKLNNLPKVRYNIETKIDPKGDGILHPDPTEFVSLVMEVIKKKHIGNRTTIQSFDPRTLRILNDRPEGIRLSFLVEKKQSGEFSTWIQRLGFKPDVISPEFSLVTPELIDFFHKQGVRVIVWTVNELPDLFRMAELGVDGIISDYPDRFDVLPADR